VALWKDNARGVHEIALEGGAQGILLALHRHPAIRRAADGRAPEQDMGDLRLAEVTQLRPAPRAHPVTEPTPEPSLSPADYSVLTGWSEALAQAEHADPAAIDAALTDARAGARWRTQLRLPQPSGALADALQALRPSTARRR